MELTTELNRKEYFVNLDYLRYIVAVTTAEGNALREELNGIIEQHGEKINLHSKEDAIRIIKLLINIDRDEELKITSENLVSWFQQTKNVFFIKLKEYRRCLDKYKKIVSFIFSLADWKGKCLDDFMNSSLRTTTIYPEFSLNSRGEISMLKPAMPFSTAEIIRILFFNVAIQFESKGEMIDFLEKYDDIIWLYGQGRELLISGKVLYANIIINECEIIPFSEGENELKRLIEQFNLEYRSKSKMSSTIIIED